MKNQNPVYNGPVKKDGKPWFSIKNDAGNHAEILIYDQIGSDYFGESVSAKDFAEQLKAIPANKEIHLRINSPGGSVWDGLAIHNLLKQRRNNVIAFIDGIAASTASWLPLAAKEVRIPKNGIMMIHDPASFVFGSSSDLRKEAEVLDQHKASIVSIYEEKTGQKKSAIEKKMTDETWFTGAEAVDFGLADTLIDEVQISNTFDFSGFRNAPKQLTEKSKQPQSAARNDAGGHKGKSMNREKMIALLNKHGIKFNKDATDDELWNLVEQVANKAPEQTEKKPANQPEPKNDTDLSEIAKEMKALREARENDRKNRLESEINNLITECRIPANEKDQWLSAVISNETILTNLKRLPQVAPAGDPLNPRIDVVEDIRDIEKHAVKLQGMNRALFIKKNEKRIREVLNANTISSDLKRVVILQDVVRAFAKQLFPLRGFSTVHANVALQGTNEVAVPYYALDSSSSTDFNASNGYDTFGGTATSSKKVTVNKRKYQGMSFTSDEFRRQPYFNVMQLMALKAEKLGVDVWTDVLSVITAANYGSAVFTGAASTFDSDSIVDVRKVCNQAQWPQPGRSLFVDSAYDANLLKDSAIKAALNFGSSDPVQSGTIPQIFGFSYYQSPNIPANSENLVGFAAFQSAILAATAPIQPTEEVMQKLAAYEVVVDDTTGIAMEYRRWGNPDMDTAKETIECNYGYVLGEAAALKRFVSA